jgi:ribosomal protein S27E
MGLFDLVDRYIQERGSSAVLDKHLAFIRDQAQALEKQVEKLEAENASLKEQLGQYQGQLQAQSRGDEFVEHRGALFKRKPEGGYHLAVYCPHCRNSAFAFGHLPYSCKRCHWNADFSKGDLQKIMAELPSPENPTPKPQPWPAQPEDRRLDEVAEKALLKLANFSIPITKNQILASFGAGLSPAKCRYYFEEWERRGFVELAFDDNLPGGIQATPKAREYLAKHNLL